VKDFLLEYDRSERRLVRLEEYGENREQASAARLAAELAAMAGNLDREIVTIESESLDVLRRTHGSYFDQPDQLRANFPPEKAA
jgi:hypothetical protein